ncbi:Fic family protein [Glutamicibacter sp.]|uniref:Fic family protein n=1 Tax=Glutamicibacter sp. TaxID=1931995 RepID=UPI0028BE931E|nr:Fic family protein [Glutamicibacter sp.]
MEWPAHTSEVRPWSPQGRVPREDRMVTEVTVSIPPMIANLNYEPPLAVFLASEKATTKISALNNESGHQLAAISGFLLRSEAVSSSKIERVNASRNDYAKATVGLKASKDAEQIVAATMAIQKMIDSAKDGAITLEALLEAHHILLKADPIDAQYAGRLREVQNWIGGSDYSPRGAVHVPPPHELVPALIEDLLIFANRDDIPVMAQAAIVHAQFESIHPFTDGNGRIGRALIGAVLRRRNLTTTTVVPIASAMVSDVETYFSLVNNYRNGAVTDFVHYLCVCAERAADASQDSIRALNELPEQWKQVVGANQNSAALKIIDQLLNHPVIDSSQAAHFAGVKESSIYYALDLLVDNEVLEVVSSSKRNRAWAAGDVLDEIDRLNDRLRQTNLKG